MHYSSIKEKTWDTVRLLSYDDMMKDFILVGGTALALHINHRLSEDVDLFTDKKYIDNDKLKDFVKKIFTDYRILDEYENYIEFLANDTKLTFYSFGMPIERESLINNLNIATKNECIAMKAHTITMRTSYKDYYDLYSIIQDGSSLSEIIRLTEEKYKTYFNTKLFLERLLKDVAGDTLENPKYKVSSEDLKEFMVDKIENYVLYLEKNMKFQKYAGTYRKDGLDAAVAEMKRDKVADSVIKFHYKEIFPDRTLTEVEKAVKAAEKDNDMER